MTIMMVMMMTIMMMMIRMRMMMTVMIIIVKTLQAPCQNWVAVLRSLLVLLPGSIDRHLAQDIIEVQDLMCDCTHS